MYNEHPHSQHQHVPGLPAEHRAFAMLEILEQIGYHLSKPDLRSCTIVCRAWHIHFSPYLDWLALDNTDQILNWVIAQRKALDPDFKVETEPHKNAELEKDFLRHIEALVKRIESPSAPFEFHSRQRTTLSNGPSYLSFVLKSQLCSNVQSIDFRYPQPYSGGGWRPDDDHRNSHQRPNLVCRLIEQSRDLRDLKLYDVNIRHEFFYWPSTLEQKTDENLKDGDANSNTSTKQERQQQRYRTRRVSNQRVLSMISRPLASPQWPKLASVIIDHLECDRYFIRILLSNSPGLQTLFLIEVEFIDRTEREVHQEIRKGVNSVNIENNDRDREVDDHDDYLDLDKNIYLQSSCLEQLQLNSVYGITWTEQVEFAERFPRLRTFQFNMPMTQRRSGPVRGSRRRPVPESIFPNLQSLIIGPMGSQYDIATILLGGSGKVVTSTYTKTTTTPEGLEALTLNHVYMNDRMLAGIKTHAWSLTSIELTPWQTDRIQNGEVMPDTHRLVHSLLRGLPRLLSFKLKYWSLKFTPTWLQTPWACQDLEHLVLRPYCDDDESLGLTAIDSQIAFLTHVGGLRRLKTLDFNGAVGSRDFYPEAHLDLLQDLKELETIVLSSRGLESSALLTAEHADRMIRIWPKIQAIGGLYHYAVPEFVSYIKTHRPDIGLAF
ncbi:hypothetical protein BGZ83_009674 [Gryganskiella cystojenkinii]|nr:hypothetical protein BGZ83_009674 [Gryganskiella cystojenkinii]